MYFRADVIEAQAFCGCNMCGRGTKRCLSKKISRGNISIYSETRTGINPFELFCAPERRKNYSVQAPTPESRSSPRAKHIQLILYVVSFIQDSSSYRFIYSPLFYAWHPTNITFHHIHQRLWNVIIASHIHFSNNWFTSCYFFYPVWFN